MVRITRPALINVHSQQPFFGYDSQGMIYQSIQIPELTILSKKKRVCSPSSTVIYQFRMNHIPIEHINRINNQTNGVN